jgi:hypothetical protein
MSERKDIRTNEREWTGMSAQHRQTNLTKPYTRTKQSNFTSIVKTILVAIILITCLVTLYDVNQTCIKRVGPNSAICID